MDTDGDGAAGAATKWTAGVPPAAASAGSVALKWSSTFPVSPRAAPETGAVQWELAFFAARQDSLSL